AFASAGTAAWQISSLRDVARGELPADCDPQTRQGWALGSVVSLQAWHPRAAVAQSALDAAFTELEQIEQLMSIYRSNSHIGRLNRDGVLLNPHPFLTEVLRISLHISSLTDGAFDVTIQPLWALFTAARRMNRLPTTQEVDTARSHVNWQNISVEDGKITLARGTQISLNGIAQGFAADRVRETLVAHGVRHALIDTGEIHTLGISPSRNDDWTVAIQHPRAPQSYLSMAKLAGRCLTTSGDYATTFTDDYVHHHLFDPRTGYSPQGFASVSIAADSATWADALSTAVYVLGPTRCHAFLQQFPHIDALLVTKNGEQFMTPGFPVAS
ncbi:MAG: FAD:protein FMN transferase, partial [Planctomycetales bacterium]|nr:FAD:protein FMN transferase [Planctomycetales bacterium]